MSSLFNARRVRFPVLIVLLLALLTTEASATWSILIVNTATGEVALGIATCLTGFDLRPATVVIVPEFGVAAAQSFIGPLSLRQLIRNQLLVGTPPSQILAMLAAADPGHQSRQYGIADVNGGRVTFTGTGAGAFANGLTGQVGTLVYAVQGNVLTGQPVLNMAEQAILNTPGDVGQKLMAAMEAARSMGGDGRCSCSTSTPPGCGSPPPSFTKAAHIGLVIVSRPGDLDAPCDGPSGCGAGSYYLDLNVANQPATAPDPIFQLQSLYNTWRSQQTGRPDHFQSTATLSTPQLLGNGNETATVTVMLRDLDGGPVTSMPTVSVTAHPSSTASDALLGPVIPLGGGLYTFDVTSGFTAGELKLDIVATDAQGAVLVAPRPVITVTDPFGPCGDGSVDDGAGGFTDLLLIDGSPGVSRVASVGFGQPFSLSLLAPPFQTSGGGPVGDFILWATTQVPTPADRFSFGNSVGSLCFTPSPLSPAAFVLADSITQSGLLPATTAPFSVTLPGIPSLINVTLQAGLIEALPLQAALSNAVLLRIVPLATPTIASVMPPSALPGTNVTLTGTGFQNGLTLDVGGVAVIPTSVTPTMITFMMPNGAGCDATVTVTNLDAQSVTATLNPTPIILFTPLSSGPAAGGGTIVISGQQLTGATLTVGGVAATITSQSATFILATAPPGTLGATPMVITSPAGCQVTATYTYL